MKDSDIFDTFMQNVTITDACWFWKRSKATGGYGQWYYDGVNMGAHRWAYRLYRGPLLPGYVIGHRCDNPPCVNPEHLEQISQKRNIQDMYDHRRRFSHLD